MRITDTRMTSDVTRHVAELVKLPSPLTGYSWQVTWLPGRHLSRNQAITAMTIAEAVAANDLTDSGHWIWLHIDQWSAELGITGPHAVAEASLSPEDHQVPRGQWPPADAQPAPVTLRADLEAAVRIWREESKPYPDEDAADSARRSGFGYCADELAQILAAHPDAQPAPELAAAQLAEIRLVLDAFDWEFDDRQSALEAIEGIVNGSQA